MADSNGYHKLARFMAYQQYPIFRKFKIIANRDLLYLQAELIALENEYLEFAKRDRNNKGEFEFYDSDWYLLSTSQARNCGGEQWQKALQIREKLREYYECVLRYSQIENTPQPRKRDVTMLEDWISQPDLGGLFFSGPDLSPGRNSLFDKAHSHDLMTLSHRTGENDLFTRLLAGPIFHGLERVFRMLKKPLPHDPENPGAQSNAFEYSDKHIIRTIDILGSIVASMTPLLSVVILYFVKSLGTRLAVLCIFTLLFSICLALVTKARRIEIFACTAAFASVQVVFVGTTTITAQN
ncbi:hypothetical protein BGZ60DRAFT_523076 [Tricladium varicosporioides]|nr:hypothetical protein BGZ60DRAFT_523076 [Hymenoscyphus varicosporioides]